MNKINRIEKFAFLINKKIEAINNKNRLALMGLLYIRPDRIFSELAREASMDSNKIAYHLNILSEADLVKKRKGKYRLTGFGKRFLKDIGFAQNIEKIYKIHELELIKPNIYFDNLSTLLQSLSNKPYYCSQIKRDKMIEASKLFYECTKRERKRLWIMHNEQNIAKNIDIRDRKVIKKFGSCLTENILKGVDFKHQLNRGEDSLTTRQNEHVMLLGR